MTDTPPKARTLAEALDIIRLHAELEELEAMTPAEQERELEGLGGDPALTRATIEAAREAAYARPPVAPVAPPAPPAAKVVDFQAARARRSPLARWGILAAAAAVALAVGGTGFQLASNGTPAKTATFATTRLPPTVDQRAAWSRKGAFRQCALGYFEECHDALDEAEKGDPEGESSPAVQAARKSIVDHHLALDPNAAGGFLAKPQVGPTERPLQRRH